MKSEVVDPDISRDIACQPAGDAKDIYVSRGNRIFHELDFENLHIRSAIDYEGPATDDLKGAWWLEYLAGRQSSAIKPLGGHLRVADFFCGAGGLANGIRQLCTELGVSVIPELIVDQDEEATRVYSASHSSRVRLSTSVQKLIDYHVRTSAGGATFTYDPEFMSDELASAVEGVDLILAGPPCQGHSNLNNQTRRSDPRNSLYLTVPAFAVAANAKMCIIENVPAVVKDRGQVVEIATQLFESKGYLVETGFLTASEMGWPQTRRRHFLVARKGISPAPLSDVAALLKDDPRSIWWAIGHLEDSIGEEILDQVSDLSQENQARIDWLFDNDKYELALEERPESHRKGTTYMAVYGRMRKNLPAPTITTGFMTPGRGRYTHPTRRRVLTPREAARLQGFPDTYRFVTDPANPPARSLLAKWIGDAVPMPLGYAAAISALAPGLPTSIIAPASS